MKIFKSCISLIILLFLITSFSCAEELKEDNFSKDEVKEYFRASYNLEKYDEALLILNNLEKNFYDEEIYLLLGNIAKSKNDIKSAIESYNKAISLNKKYFKAYYNLGNLYFEEENYPTAINFYKKAVVYNREFAPTYYNLGCSYLELKEYKKAKNNFIKAINYNPQNEKYYFNLAYSYKMLKKEKTAEKIINNYNLQTKKEINSK